MFKKYDADESGSIDVQEFKFLVADLGHHLSNEEIDMAVKMMDTTGSGHIKMADFCKWWNQSDRFQLLALSEEELQTLAVASADFQRFDEDFSGTITRDEFPNLYNVLVQSGLTKHSLEKCLEDLDTNRDGCISFNEYVDWLQRNKALKVKLVLPEAASPAPPASPGPPESS